jgi:hypothetical protein
MSKSKQPNGVWLTKKQSARRLKISERTFDRLRQTFPALLMAFRGISSKKIVFRQADVLGFEQYFPASRKEGGAE